MGADVRLLDAAADDFAAALEWYLSAGLRLGQDFEAAVDETLERISAAPGRGQRAGRLFRSQRVRRFPYRILYRQIGEAVEVVAVAHQSRRPGYWQSRLRQPNPVL